MRSKGAKARPQDRQACRRAFPEAAEWRPHHHDAAPSSTCDPCVERSTATQSKGTSRCSVVLRLGRRRCWPGSWAAHMRAHACAHSKAGHQAYALLLIAEIAARSEAPTGEQAKAYYSQAFTLAGFLESPYVGTIRTETKMHVQRAQGILPQPTPLLPSGGSPAASGWVCHPADMSSIAAALQGIEEFLIGRHQLAVSEHG
jgi:hypothetical protein